MIVGNNTAKVSSNAIRDFSFLKKFQITIHSPKIPTLKEVIWKPPMVNWYKCNIDGASSGNPGNAACGGVFRDTFSEFLFAFAEPLGIASSYHAEICGALRAIEFAFENHWSNLWLETDSLLVVSAFTHPDRPVVWPLRSRWKNVQVRLRGMNIIVTHIYREGNKVADQLANFGLTAIGFSTWSIAPEFLKDSLENNKLGMPNFRICNV
jgi:ribonuclease HI